MDALLTRWTASNKHPQHLFPGTHTDIIMLLQEWVTRRKQSNAQINAARAELQATSKASLLLKPIIQRFPKTEKQKVMERVLELLLHTKALSSAEQHETLLATYLLSTLAYRGFRKPNYGPEVRVEEAVCAYLAQVFPTFDRRAELSSLLDREAEERLEATTVEIAKAVREETGVDVSVDSEAGAAAIIKRLAGYVERGKRGME